jgi:hypothetical protein
VLFSTDVLLEEVYAKKFYDLGPTMQVYHQTPPPGKCSGSGRKEGGGEELEGGTDSLGCMYTPLHAMTEVMLHGSSFVIPTAATRTPMQSVGNLTLGDDVHSNPEHPNPSLECVFLSVTFLPP